MEENKYNNLSISDKINFLEEELEKKRRWGTLSLEEKYEIEQKISSLRLTVGKLDKFRAKLSGYKPSTDEIKGPWVKGKSEPLGHVQRIDMASYEDSNSYEDLTKSKEEEKREIKVHCPKCGYGFNHEVIISGQVTGGIGGAAAGAILGGKIGLALGPLGAIAGTIPGAILGGIFGKDFGNDFDNPRCPSCATKFQIPNSLK